MARPEPVQAPVRIERLAHEGRGVARIGGKTCFVEGALAGELVRIELVRRRARFDEARVLEVLEPAAERQAPPCRYYGLCGGCSLQHLAPAAQLAHKQAVLLELLEREAGRPAAVLPPLAGPALGYRHKARLGVKRVPKKGGVLIGFRERGKPYITDMRACPVLHPAAGERIGALRALLESLSIAAQVPQLEVAVDDAGRCALILRHLAEPTPADREALAEFGRANAIAFYLQPGGPETVTPLAGAVPLSYTLPAEDLRIGFEPADFTQVNFAVNRALVERVAGLLEPRAGEAGLDLFCGLGNFTLALARRGGRWLGLEGEAGLIERARANAERNGVGNLRFEQADLAADPLPPAARGPAEKVLLDPPRTGAEALLRGLDYSRLRRLVYVSCNPATLARDCAYLVRERGLRLEAAGAVDMFPHTAHLESVAVLGR